MGRAKIVSFFDDDFIPADDYLAGYRGMRLPQFWMQLQLPHL